MTSASDAIGDEELHAFVDGELDAKRAARIEARLVEDSNVAAAVLGIRAQKACLRRAFDRVLDEPVPSRLVAAKPTPRLPGAR